MGVWAKIIRWYYWHKLVRSVNDLPMPKDSKRDEHGRCTDSSGQCAYGLGHRGEHSYEPHTGDCKHIDRPTKTCPFCGATP